MKRAAIYARFSSDLQSDRSIEDQVALCRAKAKRDGLDVVAEFEDRAKSGASIIGRAGISRMIEAARAGAFDVLLVEALDRVSRDQEDMAFIFKRLSFQNIDIVSVHDGRADQIQVGVRGIVSALYLTDLANKTRRGQAGNIRAGKHAGGLAYGYRVKTGQPGQWEINDEEAAVVRRIYSDYVSGVGPKTLCMRLMAEGVKPPRKAPFWLPNTLLGSRKRQNGILANETYVGRLVWNRTRFIKDPDTGKRISRLNPESEWHRADVPHLQIIEPELFERAAKTRRKFATETKPRLKRPVSLFSGLLRCGACGGNLAIRGVGSKGTKVSCSAHQKAKACTNSRVYNLPEIERTILEGLRTELADPAGIEIFLRTYQEERAKLARTKIKNRGNIERQLTAARRKLERALDEQAGGDMPLEHYRPGIKAAYAEVARLDSELAAAEPAPNVVALHPGATARYMAHLERLASASAGEDAEAIRELVASASVRPTAAGEPLVIDVEGRLAALLGVPLFPQASLVGTSGCGDRI